MKYGKFFIIIFTYFIVSIADAAISTRSLPITQNDKIITSADNFVKIFEGYTYQNTEYEINKFAKNNKLKIINASITRDATYYIVIVTFERK